MKKGISPLIAAVILLAFVIAVAVLVSTFFTGTTERWARDIEDETPVDCALMNLEILSTDATPESVTVDYWSMGSEVKSGVAVNIYQNGSFMNNTRSQESLEIGEVGTVTVDGLGLVDGDEVEVNVVSLDCGEVSTEYEFIADFEITVQ